MIFGGLCSVIHGLTYYKLHFFLLVGFESQAEWTTILDYLNNQSFFSWAWTGGQYDSDSNSYKWIGSDMAVNRSLIS